jgi:hypothetical protein
MKAATPITAWLQGQLRSAQGWLLLDAFLLLVLGVFALLVTFGLLYLALMLGFDWLIADDETRFWACGGLIVVLFVLHRLTNHARLERELLLAAGDARLSMLYVFGLAPAPTTSATTWVKLFAVLLMGGPRLMTAFVAVLKRLRFLRSADSAGAAAALTFLVERELRATRGEVERALPRDREPAPVWALLHEIDGVLIHDTEPPSVSLTSELRDELRGLLRRGTAAE